jgi:hypothetical protein
LAVVMAIALVAAASTAFAMSQRERPRPRPAAKASVFVTPGGSDARSCRSRREACASLDRGYRAARPGEVVEVSAGDYPEQTILADPSKTSRRHVVIRPARGARVTLRGLTLGSAVPGEGPKHLTVERMRMAFATPNQQLSATAMPGTADVTLRDLDAGNFTLWGVKDFRVEGGDWGPCHVAMDAPCSNAKIDAGPPGFDTKRVTVDGAHFHDYRFSPSCFQAGQDCHFECMYLNGSRDVTIRRSTFRDCALFDIFVTLSGPDAARVGHRNLRIVGNVFDTPWDENPQAARRARASAVSLGWCQNSPLGYGNVLVAFNSFQSATGLSVDPSTPCRFENVRVVGNLLAWDGCDPRWKYAYNVFSSTLRRGRCADTDRIAGDRLPYASAASGTDLDLRLREGNTVADELVPAAAARCPARDIDGDPRPRKGPCTAGADERGDD